MLKIFIPEIEKHRNETTIRPFLQNADLFRDVGIEFVTQGTKYDMIWIAQASYMDKSKPYHESINLGIEYVNQFKGQDVIMLDGQDSATLMGSWDVFKETEAKLLLKNTLYKDKSNYVLDGRLYWPPTQLDGLTDYIFQKDFSKIKLSGTNWLSTIQPNWYDYSNLTKDIDVFAMFQYPAKQNFEWQVETSKYYTAHREKCITELKKLPNNIKIITAETGKVPLAEYYNLMSRSKIVIAPFGYGEIAPRDLESAMLGCVLVKPDMEHIETVPNIYNDLTFVSCQWDFTDLGNIINHILDDHINLQQYYVENMKQAYMREYDSEKLVLHVYNLISGLDNYECEIS